MELNGISAGVELANRTPEIAFPGAHALSRPATRGQGTLTSQERERGEQCRRVCSDECISAAAVTAQGAECTQQCRPGVVEHEPLRVCLLPSVKPGTIYPRSSELLHVFGRCALCLARPRAQGEVGAAGSPSRVPDDRHTVSLGLVRPRARGFSGRGRLREAGTCLKEIAVPSCICFPFFSGTRKQASVPSEAAWGRNVHLA